VGGRLICSDDDLFVLNMAKEKNGIVVSLDQFRDAYSNTRDKEIKDVIKHRCFSFTYTNVLKTYTWVSLTGAPDNEIPWFVSRRNSLSGRTRYPAKTAG